MARFALADRARDCGLFALLCGWCLATAAAAQPLPSPTVQERTLHTPRRWDANGWVVLGASWRDDSLVLAERVAKDTVVRFYIIKADRIVDDARPPIPAANHPVHLDDGRVLVFRPGSFEIHSAAAAADPVVIPLDNIGWIGRIVRQRDRVWFHGGGAADQIGFVLNLTDQQVTRLGPFYYPAAISDETVAYTDGPPNYGLFTAPFDASTGRVGVPQLHVAGPVYMSLPACGEGRLVCQLGGGEAPRIALLSEQGSVLRYLSGHDRSGRSPQVSPDGRYVAYAHKEPADRHAAVVEIVDCHARLLYQQLIGAFPIATAYHWSQTDNACLVFSQDYRGEIGATLVRFSEQ